MSSLKVPKDWLLRSSSSIDPSISIKLSKKWNLPSVIFDIVQQRSFHLESEIESYLEPSLQDLPNPFLLPDMDKGVDRIIAALNKREKILLFGDYDVDGISGSSLLYLFLRELGFLAEVLLPNRFDDGYGLGKEIISKILRIKPDLLITIDNGTASFDAVKKFKEEGIETIIIDHHEKPSRDKRPPAVALINPKDDSSQIQENLAAAGLVFLFLMALRSKLRDKGISPLPNLKRYLDIATLGTIADVVPLQKTNRIIVKHGLLELAKTQKPGLQCLLKLSDCPEVLEASHVGFRLGPRINAAGRIEDPKIAFELLTTENKARAEELANKLQTLNTKRQSLEEKALKEAITQITETQSRHHGLVAYSPNFHLGIVGIIAARLVDQFKKPSIVLSCLPEKGVAKGSARTVSGFSVHKALKEIESTMLQFGGHDAAAGMTVDLKKIENFVRSFDQSVKTLWNNEQTGTLYFDAHLPFESITAELMQGLAKLAPYGASNAEPVFITNSVKFSAVRLVGSQHIKSILHQSKFSYDGIFFGGRPQLQKILGYPHHFVAFSPQWHVWTGIKTLQLKVRDIFPDSSFEL